MRDVALIEMIISNEALESSTVQQPAAVVEPVITSTVEYCQ